MLNPSDLKRVVDSNKPVSPEALGVEGAHGFYLGATGKSIQTTLPQIKDGFTYHVPCFVNWSLHDVLAHLLHFTGPADVCITSWAISEEPVRKIIQLIQQGLIRRIHCIFDERVRRYCPAALQIAGNNLGKIHLTGIHAKVLVIENENWGISVTSTANATNKKRIEKYVIACVREAAEHDRKWIHKLIYNEKPFSA